MKNLSEYITEHWSDFDDYYDKPACEPVVEPEPIDGTCADCEAPVEPCDYAGPDVPCATPLPTTIIKSKPNELGISMNNEEFEQLKAKLTDALAEEFNAWYQYVIIRSFLTGPMRPEIVEFFDETAKDELEDHAYWLMDRLNQLGCDATTLVDPAFWNTTATHKYIYPSTDVKSAINNNIKAEQGAIETYTALEEFTRDKDVVTNSKIKEILKDEQEHLAELYDLQKDIENYKF